MKCCALVSTIFILIYKTSAIYHENILQSSISRSICEVIADFYSKYSKNVDIIDFGRSQGDLMKKIMENLNNSMSVTLHKPRNVGSWTENLTSQSILLFDKFEDLNDFNNKDLIEIRYINPVKILVYCENATESDISRLNTVLVIPPYYYFIIVDRIDMKIKLFTFENRNDLIVCHESQRLLQINEFSTANLTWINEPIFQKKYQNFYDCEMFVGVFGTTNFFKTTGNGQTATVSGLLTLLLNDISRHLNFSINYALCKKDSCIDYIDGPFHLYNVLIITTLDGYAVNSAVSGAHKIKWTNVMMNIQCTPQLYVPPGDLYTSFEKMVLPFDIETWISMMITFLSAIFAIMIINRLPKFIRNVFYGSTVSTPILNIFRTFLGDGQTKLPSENSARLILLSFILWCLVMRTAYQGKLFEFTTTALRKPEIKSLEALWAKNFTLYMQQNLLSLQMDEFIENAVSLNIKYVTRNDYITIYTKNITDPSFTGTILTCDVEHKLNVHYTENPMKDRFVSIPITKSDYAFGFSYPNLWNERLQEIVEGLVTGGIVNRNLELMTKSKWNLMTDEFGTEKVVLNLSHLGFGFQICFFAIYIAFLVFLMELVIAWTSRTLQNSRSNDSVHRTMHALVERTFHVLTFVAIQYNQEPENIPTEKLSSTNDIEGLTTVNVVTPPLIDQFLNDDKELEILLCETSELTKSASQLNVEVRPLSPTSTFSFDF